MEMRNGVMTFYASIRMLCHLLCSGFTFVAQVFRTVLTVLLHQVVEENSTASLAVIVSRQTSRRISKQATRLWILTPQIPTKQVLVAEQADPRLSEHGQWRTS